jgi:hypothetical protein
MENKKPHLCHETISLPLGNHSTRSCVETEGLKATYSRSMLMIDVSACIPVVVALTGEWLM